MKDIIGEVKSNKQFKKVVITTGDDPSLKISKLKFEVPALDDLLCGGLPAGKLSLVYGDSHVGKSFLMQKLIASAQKQGKAIVFIDADKSFEPEWWKLTGVDIAKLPIAQPDYGEQAFDLVHHFLEQGIDLLILDSLDLLVPTAEVEASMETSFMGLQARMNAAGLRKSKRANNKTVFVCTNHIREGIGKYSQFHIPGGKAQEDMASVMLWVARGASIKEADVVTGGDDKKKVGFKMRVTIEKDKIHGKMFQSCELPFMFEGGAIDTLAALVEVCIEAGLISKGKGPYYELYEEKILGKLGIKKYLNEHPDIQEKLRGQLNAR